MSIFEIQRLQGLVPSSALGAREGAELDKSPADKSGSKQTSASTGGVSVEVSKRVDAGEPPVSSERVAEIRAALRDGSYPLVPAEIADAMIAARLSMGLGE